MLEVFHANIANLARYRKWVFFFKIWDQKIDWFPLRPFGLTFLKNNWWGVWPSSQMIKNCCWPIWAPKSAKKFRPKKRFSQIWFLDREIFCLKKVSNIQIVPHPYLVRLSKNVLEAFHEDITICESRQKRVFQNCHFWALWPLHTPGMDQKFCRTQKWSGLLFLSALPLNAWLVVLLKCY